MKKLKLGIREILFISVVGFGGLLFVKFVGAPLGTYYVSNVMFKMGAEIEIKSTENCVAFQKQYISELQKGKNGQPVRVIEEAKKVGCKK